MNIIANKIKCNKCGEIIESKSEHDFKFCKCGAVAVDGGLEYLRRCGNREDWEELAEYGYRKMRRSKQLLLEDEAIEILNRNTSGTLAVLGDEDYPYAVPMSYVYADGKIYFHSAKSGHKIDAINRHKKVSFTVIDKDEIVPKKYTTYFRSVIAFGKAFFIEDVDEIKRIATVLAMKYSSDFKEGIADEIESSINAMAIIQLDIEYMTAKEAIELVNMKK